ncbi:hypothetical protein E4U53_006286, partial [Claviceps sorghi]
MRAADALKVKPSISRYPVSGPSQIIASCFLQQRRPTHLDRSKWITLATASSKRLLKKQP